MCKIPHSLPVRSTYFFLEVLLFADQEFKLLNKFITHNILPVAFGCKKNLVAHQEFPEVRERKGSQGQGFANPTAGGAVEI